MENRHTLVTSNDCVIDKPSDNNESSQDEARDALSVIPSIQGYLFKRTSNAFKTWNRRWFSLQENQLVYRKRSGKLMSIKLVCLCGQYSVPIFGSYQKCLCKVGNFDPVRIFWSHAFYHMCSRGRCNHHGGRFETLHSETCYWRRKKILLRSSFP